MCSEASKGRVRPSQLTNEPAFSATGAIGNTTSARVVTALSRSSRLTTNGAASMAAIAASGSGRSWSSTPPISKAPSSPRPAACRIASVSRPSPTGRPSTFHAAASCARAVSSVTGRPPGNRFAIAPASNAPRSPARRGTHASRAPVADARRPAAESAPGDAASRSPTRISEPGRLSSSSPARSSSAVASPPGPVLISLPDSLARPRVAKDAMDNTCRPRLRTALRSRRKTIGTSSSGSSPASSTAGACSRSE